MITDSVTISSKGQIVLPKSVRNALNTQHIIFEIDNGIITVKPLINVKGSLSKYFIENNNFSEIRDQAWEEESKDHHV